ncbi:MAG TPA: tRNA pseudouridine(38-40) synthase TruA [Candidatus Cybelea sp.]|nr:tRNA pseudouridine(38-40) synthase TruA [Candidatus Cybelea sp.]
MDVGDARGLRDDGEFELPARSRRGKDGAAGSLPGLTTLRLTVEYDGSGFAGFQWQPTLRTVAGVLEEALSRLFCEPVKLTAAGRTDSGVHATGQVVSLKTAASFAFDRLPLALNAILPDDCSVREASVVEADFSARFGARERTYVYVILNRPRPSALLNRYAWHLPHPLELDAMRSAAERTLGEHDFLGFCGSLPLDSGGEPASTVRCVTRFSVERRGALVRLEVAANGFLHRMVRTLAGTLTECGRGRRPASDISGILARAERGLAGPVAPAGGLYLAGVRYAGGYDSFAEPPVLGPPTRDLD